MFSACMRPGQLQKFGISWHAVRKAIGWRPRQQQKFVHIWKTKLPTKVISSAGLHCTTHASHRIIYPKRNSCLLTDAISSTSTKKVSSTCYFTAQLPQTSEICFVAFLVFPGSCLLGMLFKVGVHRKMTKQSRICRWWSLVLSFGVYGQRGTKDVFMEFQLL